MTVFASAHYSGPTMRDDLAALEAKLALFIAQFEAMRAENRSLRTQVASLEADRRGLQEKVEAARGRLKSLLERLPEH